MVTTKILSFVIMATAMVGFVSGAVSNAADPSQAPHGNSITTEEPWIPATSPRDFSYDVVDGIKGASQFRQESWKDGVMKGVYSLPMGDGKWQVIEYIADEKGYRIVSTRIISEADLVKGHAADTDTANIDINSDGHKTSYKVKADEIATEKPKSADSPPKSSRSAADHHEHDHSVHGGRQLASEHDHPHSVHGGRQLASEYGHHHPVHGGRQSGSEHHRHSHPHSPFAREVDDADTDNHTGSETHQH